MADHKCCCIHLLQSQPDFVSQRSVLAETVEASGHIFELYPRFHCECNPIERYWGAAKRVARRECTYSFRDLNSNIHDFLDSVSPPNEEPLQIRRYSLWRTNCFRYLIPLTKFGRAVDSGNGIVDFFKGLFNFYMKLKFIRVKIKK